MIDDYWTRCRIAQSWDERMKEIEDTGLVPRGLRNDPIKDIREKKTDEGTDSSVDSSVTSSEGSREV